MMILLFLSATLFYLVPIGVGALVLQLLSFLPGFAPQHPAKHSLINRLKNFLHHAPEPSIPAIFTTAATQFIVGAATLLGLGLVVAAGASQFSGISFAPHFFWLSYLLSLGGWAVQLPQFLKYRRAHYLSLLKPVTASLGLSVIAYGIWQLHAPYPLNWDLYEHQTLAQIITAGRFSFSTAALSDTFGFASYPPTFHTLLALAQYPLSLSPQLVLQFWLVTSFLHLWTVSLASFTLCWSVTRSKTAAYLSMIFGTLLFESVVAFTSLFILPQTVAATVWALLLARIYTADTEKHSLAPGEIVLTLVSLALFHFVIGGFGAVVLLVSWLFFKVQGYFKLRQHHLLLWASTAVIALLGFAASYVIDLSSINSGEAAEYAFSFSQAIQYFLQFYSMLPLLGLLGIWMLYKKHSSTSLHLGLLSLAFVALLLSHFPYAFKFLTLGRFILFTVMSIGLLELLKKNTLRGIVIAGVSICSVLILVLNAHNWQEHIMTGTEVRHISQDDIAAAEFLTQNYSHRTTLITDPTTGYVLEGLSGVNSVGGAFATEATRIAFYQAGKDGFRTTPLQDLKSISDPVITNPDTQLLVLSGRTFRWLIAEEAQRNSFGYNIWRPIELSGYNTSIITDLVEKEELTVVYTNPSYYIIALTN